MSTVWVDEVLAFWFGELDREAWFKKSDAVDQTIRDRFQSTYGRVSRELPVGDLTAGPRLVLASVVVLDQFPRNMFRGTSRMYESDPKALTLARVSLDLGLDQQVEAAHRIFLYLPFEHSEQLADQERSVALFTALGNANDLRYAVAHRDIVARFGRFPHRNDILGRVSTAEEVEFLKQPGSSF